MSVAIKNFRMFKIYSFKYVYSMGLLIAMTEENIAF